MSVDGCGPFQYGENRKKDDDRARIEDLPLKVAAIGLMGTHRGLMRGDAIPLASLTSSYRSCGRDTLGVASLQREETAAPQNRRDGVFSLIKTPGANAVLPSSCKNKVTGRARDKRREAFQMKGKLNERLSPMDSQQRWCHFGGHEGYTSLDIFPARRRVF